MFFTNYESHKGRELAANPRAALLFHWAQLGRQVRVEGRVDRADEAASDAYFDTRPLGRSARRVGLSPERAGSSRGRLEEGVERCASIWRRADPAAALGRLPGRARGYEFWQHRDDRLHDRLRYRRDSKHQPNQ